MKVSKEIQAKTLADMKKRRQTDYIFLRDIINKKLDWAKIEKKKGLEAIEKHRKQIEELEKAILRLDGCIIILTELSNQSIKETNTEQP
jgi:hypothetical protein